MHAVLIETSGNQSYIFGTNKLRENVGASELTFRCGTQWVLEAVAKLGGPTQKKLWIPIDVPLDPEDKGTVSCPNWKAVREALEAQPGIEDPMAQFEVVLASSGKALVLCKAEDKAKDLVRNVTGRALREAPGLDVCGVVGKVEMNSDATAFHKSVQALFKKLGHTVGTYPGPQARFPSFPLFAPCETSWLPANTVQGDKRASKMTQRKREVREDFWKRVAIERFEGMGGHDLTAHTHQVVKLASQVRQTIETKEEEGVLSKAGWLAVVVADANGLGEIFRKFDEKAKAKSVREYINALRKFSVEIDRCAAEALLEASKSARAKDDWYRIAPLILGGDDACFVCPGEMGLRLARDFVKAFEDKTRSSEGIKAIAPGGLTSGAGVALVKLHYPFHMAHTLAEELCRSAKDMAKKQETVCSAIDYHVVFDSTKTSLEAIRKRLTPSHGRLFMRPYLLNDAASSPLNFHFLLARIEELRRLEDGHRKFPRSVIQRWREAVFAGPKLAPATARTKLSEKLFIDDATWLLDAIEATDFWPDERRSQPPEAEGGEVTEPVAVGAP